MNGEDRMADAASRTEAGTRKSDSQFQLVLTGIIVLVICAAAWFIRDEKLAMEKILGKMEVLSSKLKVTPTDVLAEVKSLKSDSVYLSTLEDSEDAYVALNPQGNITLWSAGAEKLFGVSRDNAIGYGIAFIIPASARKKHKDAFKKAMASKGTKLTKQKIECDCLHSDGKSFPVSIKTWYIPGVRAVSLFSARSN